MKLFFKKTVLPPDPADRMYEDDADEAEHQRHVHSLGFRLSVWWSGVKRRYWDLKSIYWTKHHLVDTRHDFGPNTCYKGGYCDPCGLMFYAPFAILVEFVEEEMFQSFVDWDAEGMTERRDEIMAIYTWWTKERNAQHHEVSELFEKATGDGPFFLFGPKLDGDCREMKFQDRDEEAMEEWRKRHAALDEKDEEMLLRLIKVRSALWT